MSFCDEECCPTIIGEKADEIVQYVESWSKAHPQKTRLDDFKKKYPNAEIRADGQPKVCCVNLGYCKSCDEAGDDCKKCWNMPVEE